MQKRRGTHVARGISPIGKTLCMQGSVQDPHSYRRYIFPVGEIRGMRIAVVGHERGVCVYVCMYVCMYVCKRMCEGRKVPTENSVGGYFAIDGPVLFLSCLLPSCVRLMQS